MNLGLTALRRKPTLMLTNNQNTKLKMRGIKWYFWGPARIKLISLPKLHTKLFKKVKINHVIGILLLVHLASCGPNDGGPDVSDGSNSRPELSNLATEKIENLYDLAETSYKLMVFDITLEYLNEIIRRDSSQGKAYFRRGKAHAALEKYEESSQDYESAVMLGYHTVSCYYNIGCNYKFSKRDSLAIYYFKKALEIDPNHEKARLMIESLKKERHDRKII
jgi:tetratricopeptide (TPR) repeat protein